MRGFLLSCFALISISAFGACLGAPPPDESGGTDGGLTEAGDGGSGGDGSTSGGDGSVEGGRPAPSGNVNWVFTMDVPSVPDVRLAYDDSGNMIFADSVSGSGSSSITVNGTSYPFQGGLAVGKITPAGSLAWLKVYNVTTDIDALDIAATSSGDIWILAGLIDTGSSVTPVQNWNGGSIDKVTQHGLGDIVWANLSGTDGLFKSAYQMATSGGGVDHTDENYAAQTMRLARVGNQLVGAIGHHGPIHLPGPSGDISVASQGNEAVTVFRADPVTGVVTSNDVFTGTAAGLTPGGIAVRADGTMAVTLNVASAHNETIDNSVNTGGRGGITFSQGGAGDDTASTVDAHSWFLLVVYSPTDGVSLAQPFNNGGDNSAPPVNLVETGAVSLDSAGNIEIAGRYIGTGVQMNNVSFASLDGDEDSFIATLSPIGNVIAQPIVASTNTDGYARAAFDPWDDLAATSTYGGRINLLRTTPTANDNNMAVSQFKILSDGGVSWNFGAFTNNEADPSTASAIAVDPIGGSIAIGGYFTGSSDFGKGTQSIPNGGTLGAFIVGRSP